MITAIEIENFKAIGERVRIPIKPITLLFGPNSSGKSTIIQAIHYMREILERGNVDADYTTVGDETIDLGGFRRLVHGHDLTRAVTLRFDISLGERRLPDYMDEEIGSGLLWNQYMGDDQRDLDQALSTASSGWFQVKVEWNAAVQRPVLTAYESGLDGELVGRITLEQEGERAAISCWPNWENPILPFWQTQHEKVDGTEAPIDDMVQEEITRLLARAGNNVLTATQQASVRELLAQVSTGTESVLGPIVLGGQIRLSDHYLSLPSVSSRLTIARKFASYEDRVVYEILLSRMLMGPGELVRDALRDSFRYLGPLRRVPPRHHEPARSHSESRWATGLGAWDVLASNKEVAVAANSWLSAPDRLDTGYSVELREFKEVELESDLGRKLRDEKSKSGNLVKTFDRLPVKTRLAIREKSRGLEVGPLDIGVGLSQLIPVVVAAVDRSMSLVAIEQPELHIHPAWQTRLGDLFISEAVGKNRTFLLETHSEHLLLRLLRRIRETSEEEGEDLRLIPEDIAVVYVDKVGDTARVHHLRVDQRGEFLDKWPQGFFDERAEELF